MELKSLKLKRAQTLEPAGRPAGLLYLGYDFNRLSAIVLIGDANSYIFNETGKFGII